VVLAELLFITRTVCILKLAKVKTVNSRKCYESIIRTNISK